MALADLWTEKWRPKDLEGYVFRDDEQRKQVKVWADEGSFPHLLFSGAAGTGKTTLAKVLINLSNVDEYDVLEINASRENSVDVIREKITNFVQTMPFGKFKVVLLDEADYISPNGQAALRGVMEMYHSTARFILTCNYPNRIIPALHSRCQGFHIEKLDLIEFTSRVATVLCHEEIEFELETLDAYVRGTYPDLRKCLNNLQMNSGTGTLTKPSESTAGGQDFLTKAVEQLKAGDLRAARATICDNLRADEIESIWPWMYDNLDLWGKTDDKKDAAILAIRKGMVNHTMSACPEINVSATLTELIINLES